MQSYDAIIAGLGSMGSAALYTLAARSYRVLGIDRFDVPNTLGSSIGVNRIIRLAYAEHPDYVPLLHRAYALWRDLEQISGERLLVITGGIDAGPETGVIVRGSLRSCAAHQLPHDVLTARELGDRFPGYRLPADMCAVYQPDGGFLMSERCVTTYVRQALVLGAEIHGRERVAGWDVTADGVRVKTEYRTYEARRLIVAAGPWTAGLVPRLAPLAIPERQVLLWTQPLSPDRFRPDNFPVFNLEAADGRYYGFPVYEVPGFKMGKYHHRHEATDADAVVRECSPEDEAVLRDGVRRYFPEADGPTLAMKVCMFTNSPDEHFLLDRYPGAPEVVIAAGFSGHGFKFCSVVGEIAADLAMEGRTRWNIDLFRLGRFAGSE
jgi:sarcosine oxidase